MLQNIAKNVLEQISRLAVKMTSLQEFEKLYANFVESIEKLKDFTHEIYIKFCNYEIDDYAFAAANGLYENNREIKREDIIRLFYAVYGDRRFLNELSVDDQEKEVLARDKALEEFSKLTG